MIFQTEHMGIMVIIFRSLDGGLDGGLLHALSNEKEESKENTEITFPSNPTSSKIKTS